MGLLERMARLHQEPARSWPVGESTARFDGGRGHDDGRFSPERYGDYLATSNDIYSVASLRARHMGRLQPLLFDGDGPDRVTVTAGPTRDLLNKVNDFWTFQRLVRMDELCMCVWGESYWAVQRDGRGQPVEIWWMKPTQVRPVVHDRDYLAGYTYQPITGGKPIRFDVDEVIWFRYPNPIDEFSPLSPLAAARLAADTSASMMRSNKVMFDQGMQLAGTITPPSDGGRAVTFSPDQARELEEDLSNRFAGVGKAHRWAVLRFDAKVNPFGVSQKDAEFIAGLGLTFRQVCRAYGINPALLGDNEHATLANAREFELQLWQDALQPDADFRAAEIREQFLPMFRGGPDHFEWDYSKIPALQEAESAVWEREGAQLERGALTINEWRKSKGLAEVPWGDVWWAPVNKAPIADDQVNPTNEPPVRPATDPMPSPDPAARDLLVLRAALNGHGRPRQGALT